MQSQLPAAISMLFYGEANVLTKMLNNLMRYELTGLVFFTFNEILTAEV